MWYVVQVTSGQEARACELIRASVQDRLGETPLAADALQECFVPLFQAEQKHRGAFKLVELKLFPGYVIAISRNVEVLNSVLRSVTAFTRILGNDRQFIPLDRAEMAFINSFTTEKHRVIQTSRAVAEGDAIRVIDGPMMGHEAWIQKINRRKGTALIQTEMFKRTITVEIGLAVVTRA